MRCVALSAEEELASVIGSFRDVARYAKVGDCDFV